MAEEGSKPQAGQPVMGKGAGGAQFMQGVSRDLVSVAAAQTNANLQVSAGATGDYLESITIVPAALAAGNVSLKDGAGSAISLFVTGTLADLKPIVIPIKAFSKAGAWNVTTGANVSIVASGSFS